MAHPCTFKSGFVNPYWYQKYYGKIIEGKFTVVESAFGFKRPGIKAEGETFVFDNELAGELNLKVDQKAFVIVGNNIRFETQDEYNFRIENERQRKEAAKRKQEEERQKYLAELERRRKEAKEFNDSLNIPVNWTIGQNLVMSGLSGSSWGDGLNKASVNHVLLLDDINEGRFKRNEYQFLCKSKGKHTNTYSTSKDEDRNEVHPGCKVTCKSCLKVAKRWSSNLEV